MTYKKERGMGMELKIPENFFVGAAMSGPQTEGAYKTGGRLESIWDTWSDLCRLGKKSPHGGRAFAGTYFRLQSDH